MKNILIILLLINTSYCFCQKKKSNYFDKATTVEVTAMVNADSIQAMLDDYERVQLPPLSVFLQSVYDHPSIKIYEAKREECSSFLIKDDCISTSSFLYREFSDTNFSVNEVLFG